MGKIVDSSGKALSSMPKITGARPVGSMVLVELLTPQELTSSVIAVGDVKVEIQQGYVLDVGPAFNKETYGFGKGDRVVLVGTSNPVPGNPGKREKRFTEPHTIKGVLIEERKNTDQ